jgi:hypothetical protein
MVTQNIKPPVQIGRVADIPEDPIFGADLPRSPRFRLPLLPPAADLRIAASTDDAGHYGHDVQPGHYGHDVQPRGRWQRKKDATRRANIAVACVAACLLVAYILWPLIRALPA